MKRLALILVCLFAMPLMAMAQDVIEDAAQPTANPVTRVLVLGDAIGGGLGAGLTRVSDPTGLSMTCRSASTRNQASPGRRSMTGLQTVSRSSPATALT